MKRSSILPELLDFRHCEPSALVDLIASGKDFV